MTDRLPKYPMLTQGEKERIRAEIVANCEMVGDCWIYKGAFDRDGYGAKRCGSKTHSTHRFMLAYATRESLNVPFDACHDTSLCPYKACCNPAHLFWATHSENCQQREDKTRELKAMFGWWEKHSWAGGVYRTEELDPSIDHCVASLNRGRIERPDQSPTGFEAEETRPFPLSTEKQALAVADSWAEAQGNPVAPLHPAAIPAVPCDITI
jgi:hypothetical protein